MICAATSTSNGSIQINEPKGDFLEWLYAEAEMYAENRRLGKYSVEYNEGQKRALARIVATYECMVSQ